MPDNKNKEQNKLVNDLYESVADALEERSDSDRRDQQSTVDFIDESLDRRKNNRRSDD